MTDCSKEDITSSFFPLRNIEYNISCDILPKQVEQERMCIDVIIYFVKYFNKHLNMIKKVYN